MFMLRKIRTCLKVQQCPTLSLKINYENSKINYSTENLKRSNLGSVSFAVVENPTCVKFRKLSTSSFKITNRNFDYDSKIRFYATKNSKCSGLGSSFADVVQNPCYVDKSMFIETVLNCWSRHILITAPRRFNKSVNLNMLRCFLESEHFKSLFAKLKIGKSPIMDLCGTYPVVYLDLKEGADDISSFKDAVEAMKMSLCNAYLQHSYLTTSPKLSTEDKKLLSMWNPMNVSSLQIFDVRAGLLDLCRLVSQHFDQGCFLLVDEYDAICTAAFPAVDADILSEIIEFNAGIIGSVVKLNQDYIERSVLTGVTQIMPAGTSNPINDVTVYRFLENRTFVDYYGILVEEFDELLSRPCNSSVQHLRDQALYYSGYSFENRCLLNTWSVMKLLEHRAVRSFWIDSGILELEPEIACKVNIVRDCFKNLLAGHSVQFERTTFSAKSLKTLFNDFSQPSNKQLIDCSPLLEFYVQLGYLKIVNNSWYDASVALPNEEIRSMLFRSLRVYFRNVYGIEQKLINDCIGALRKLNMKNEDELKKNLSSVVSSLEKMCKKVVYHKLMNESIFHDLFFTVFYAGGFQPISKDYVCHKDGLYTIYDMCAVMDTDFGIICEFKVDEDSKFALKQLAEKRYYEGLKGRGEIKNFLLLGVSVNRKKSNSISISFLKNSINLSDACEVISSS